MELFTIILLFGLLVGWLGFIVGKDIGERRVRDIPEGGKTYRIIGIRQPENYYCTADSPAENTFLILYQNTYLIVYSEQEKNPRLVELPVDSVKEEYRVGDWIYKTAAGDYQRIGAA